VFPNNVGIFTVTSDGIGSGIVTYPDYSLVSTTKAANCGGVYTTCGASNPGDVLTVWATGLGPVDGSDAAGAGLGVNMASIPLTIWLGGVQVKAAYQGRSGCCIGEDQIIFTVPPNAPLGCAVPLTIQINTTLSNSVYLPVAAAGSRTCTPADPTFSAAAVTRSASSEPIKYGQISLGRHDNNAEGGSGFEDHLYGAFLRLSIPPAVQPFLFSYVDQPPPGTCQTFNGVHGSPDPPLTDVVGLEAGQITVQGPNGSKTASSSGGEFDATLSSTGSFLSPGSYTVSVSGGTGVAASTASFTIPALPVMTSPAPHASAPIPVTRTDGLTVSWSGGSPDGRIVIHGSSATDNTFNLGASFQCLAPAGSGTFTIPPNVLMAMPPNNFGALWFEPLVQSTNWTGSGLDIATVSAKYQYYTPLAFR